MDKEDFRKLLVQWASEDVYIGQLTWEEGDALAEYFVKWQAAQQSVQRTAIAAGGLAFFAGIIISWFVLRGITRRR